MVNILWLVIASIIAGLALHFLRRNGKVANSPRFNQLGRAVVNSILAVLVVCIIGVIRNSDLGYIVGAFFTVYWASAHVEGFAGWLAVRKWRNG